MSSGGARNLFNFAQAPPPPPIPSETESKNADATSESIIKTEDTGPGPFEELHRKCKEVFPVSFEGAKLVINKGLNNHFQISHNLTMSSLQPSGYKFGCTYVGTKQFSPTESYPVLMGEMDLTGNLNAHIVHHFTRQIRCKFVSQVQNHKWALTQLGSDYKGKDFVASMTLGNIDLLKDSGTIVGQYLQNVTKRLALGSELVYQYGPSVPGSQIGMYTLGGRYTKDKWQLSGSLSPMLGGVHLCFYQRANEHLQFGVEMEGSLANREFITTIGYQVELPKAEVTFRGQIDSNWCVGAVMEKKLPPLPFTFLLSAFANHVKGTYRFGVGLTVG